MNDLYANQYVCFCVFSSIIYLIFLLFKGNFLIDMPKFRNNKVQMY